MPKEFCNSCEVRLTTPAPFCPACERPTRFASEAERVEWDLSQWRAHVDRSVAAGVSPSSGASAATAVATAPRNELKPVEKPRLVVAPEPTREPIPAGGRSSRRTGAAQRARMPKIHAPKLRRPRRERDVVIDLDNDHEFAYRACATCHEIDWIVRTTRNDDETWNYWCVRCSRLFKTEIKIHHAIKPFLSAGLVVGGLTAASLLMLH